MLDSEIETEIRGICLRLLTRREHSQQELLAKLLAKGYGLDESHKIVNELKAQGWQSDDRFSESYVRYRIKKGYGPIKINYELQQRGIDDCDLNALVIDIADNWGEILKQVYQKKYTDDSLLTDKDWIKRCRFLQQRGFSYEMIKELFQSLDIKLTR